MKRTTTQLDSILRHAKDYEEYLSKEQEDLIFVSATEFLDQMLKLKKREKSTVIKEADLDKTYAYQIFNGTKKNPSRDKVIRLAFGIHLNSDETNKLLKLFGLTPLYSRIPRDAIITIALNNERSVTQVNVTLDEYGEDPLD